MPFEVVQLAPDIYHLQSGANSGLIAVDGQAIVIDAGLDDDAGKKIRRTLDSLNLKLAALIITHAHADHFGGAAYLRRTLPAFTVYAPALEAAIIENPLLEGIMLSGGALPFEALKGKFTLAQACKVDQVIDAAATTLTIAGIDLTIVRLPGHSPAQIGIQYENVLFTADAFLPIETLEKHPIPFTAHIERTFKSFETLLSLTKKGVVLAPGHGSHLAEREVAGAVISKNDVVLQKIVSVVRNHLAQYPTTEAKLVQLLASDLNEPLSTPIAYYLARATVQAVLVKLYEQREADMVNDEPGQIKWRRIKLLEDQ